MTEHIEQAKYIYDHTIKKYDLEDLFVTKNVITLSNDNLGYEFQVYFNHDQFSIGETSYKNTQLIIERL